jgi:NhaA family Na+:H+ antiporter
VVGIVGISYLTAKFTKAELDNDLTWWDVLGVAMLGGIGFTVSLLIGELAFAGDAVRGDHVKIGVLTGTIIAAVLASIILRLRNRTYRVIEERETRDDDNDGIPDIYHHP